MPSIAPRGGLGRDEVVPLLGEIEGRLQRRDQIEQLRIERLQPRRQRPFELIEGHARLQRRHRVNQVRDRFGLHEIDPSVQVRAKRELARVGQPRAGMNRGADDRFENHGTAVRRNFDDIIAGVGVRSRKVRRDDPIDRRLVDDDVGERRATRLERGT